MRLFVAIDIEPAIRNQLAGFVSGMRGLAPAARWVGPETFHITLKFIGERPAADAEAIRQTLGEIQAEPTTVRFAGTGFFPNARSARVFWAGVDADANLASLAAQIDRSLGKLHVPPEEHAFSPHLTLARGGDPKHRRGGSGRPHSLPGDRPKSCFAGLQEKLQAMPAPDFGGMIANEYFLYESKLSSAGAHYTKLARFALERRD